MKIIKGIIKNNIIKWSDNPIILEGENLSTKIIIQVNECFCEDLYLEFLCPDFKKFISPKLEIINSEVCFNMPYQLVKKEGSLYCQLINKNPQTSSINKSRIFVILIDKSINAESEIKEDFIDIIKCSENAILKCKEDYENNLKIKMQENIEFNNKTLMQIQNSYNCIVESYNNLINSLKEKIPNGFLENYTYNIKIDKLLWQSDSIKYKYDILLDKININSNILIEINDSDKKEASENGIYKYNPTINNGKLTIYCEKKPNKDLNIKVSVVGVFKKWA